MMDGTKRKKGPRTIKVELTFDQAKALLNSPSGVGISHGIGDQHKFDPAYCALQDKIKDALAAACEHKFDKDRRCEICGCRIAFG
jgi:hypothetical protein